MLMNTKRKLVKSLSEIPISVNVRSQCVKNRKIFLECQLNKIDECINILERENVLVY